MIIEKIAVKVSEIRVAGEDTVLFAIGLGSCVAVALYDPVVRIGGLAHVMLPAPTSIRRPAPVGRFATTAIPQMVSEMQALGAMHQRMFARLIGGAAMFEAVLADEGVPLGTRNIEATRRVLAGLDLAVRSENVGGNYGRTMHFHISDGRILITSVRRPDVTL